MTCPCGNTVPKSRERYCSDKCQKIAGRKRDIKRYHKLNLPWYLADRLVDSRPLYENFCHVSGTRRKAQ